MKRFMADHIFKSNASDPLLLDALDLLNRSYRDALQSRLSPYGCNPGYIRVLKALDSEAGMSQKALLARLDMDQSTLSRTLSRMERDDLVRAERSEQDRRTTVIHLSDKGRRMINVAENALNDLDAVARTGLSVNDVRYFRRVLERIRNSLDADGQSQVLVLTDVLDE